MEVIVKRRGRPKDASRKMSVSERDALEMEKAGLEAQKNDLSYASHPEKGELNSRIKHLTSLLEKDTDEEARGKTRVQLEGIRNQLAEAIKLKVPPMSIQRSKPGTPEYQKAVDWAEKAMAPEVTKVCEQYQDICRRLEPENPSAGSIEALVA